MYFLGYSDTYLATVGDDNSDYLSRRRWVSGLYATRYQAELALEQQFERNSQNVRAYQSEAATEADRNARYPDEAPSVYYAHRLENMTRDYWTLRANYAVRVAPWDVVEDYLRALCEYDRASGENIRAYQPVKWLATSSPITDNYEAAQIAKFHYPRPCEHDARLISYYESEKHGQAGRLTHAKPGRYLAKHFSQYLTKQQIEFWASWQSTGDKPEIALPGLFIHFAKTPSEIVNVYTDSRVNSCMDSRHFSRAGNPVRVYGAGVLAVAALGFGDSASEIGQAPADWPEVPKSHREAANVCDHWVARALVNPETKTFGRVYPTEHNWQSDGFPDIEISRAIAERLERELRALGYQSLVQNPSGFNGAALVSDRSGDCVVMPYLDGLGFNYDFKTKGLTLQKNGSYDGDSTSGYYSLTGEDHDEDCDEDRAYCDECSDSIYDGEETTVTTGFRGSHPNNWSTMCEACVSTHTFTCDNTGITCDSRTVDSYDMEDGDTWCEAAFMREGFYCEETEENLPLNQTTELAGGERVATSWALANCVMTEGGDYARNEDCAFCTYDGEYYLHSYMSDIFPGFPSSMDNDDISEADRAKHLPEPEPCALTIPLDLELNKASPAYTADINPIIYLAFSRVMTWLAYRADEQHAQAMAA